MQQNWVQELTWPGVEQRLARGALALLPIGAASKEHGPHLPHGTDYFQASAYAEHVAEKIDALIWPVVSYGYYPVFTDYPGSISLKAETFKALIDEILAGIEQAGARRIVVLNTGISTIAPLNELLQARTSGTPVQLINCYAGPRFKAAVAAYSEQSFGGHADEIETSLMLMLAPEKVRAELAVAQTTPIVRGMFNHRDPSAPNYSPSGVNGNPTLAKRVKGEGLLAALLDDVVEAIRAEGD
jgi:creatinine amidohydrolase